MEGVRVLYVGMTRAIDTLICIVEESKNPVSWTNILKEYDEIEKNEYFKVSLNEVSRDLRLSETL